MTCVGCQLIEKKENAIYEDEKVIALLADTPAVPGHVIIMPKQHHTILEEITDDDASHLFAVANKVSSGLFDSLNAQGTNIILQNGVAAGQEVSHVGVNVIPRAEGDGLNFQWQPKKPSEDDMSTAELQIKDALAHSDPVAPVSTVAPSTELREDDYLVKHLRRIP